MNTKSPEPWRLFHAGSIALALCLTAAHALGATFTTNTAIGVGDTTYDGQDIVVNGCILTVNGPHGFASLLVTNTGTVTHSAAPNGETNNRLDLTITGDLGVDTLSHINLSGRGYAKLSGPGAGTTNGAGRGTGAGHGGVGGTASGGGAGGGAYDSIMEPSQWGSGGGGSEGWSGGGAGRLVVAGVMRIDGSLVADGSGSLSTGSGGGAGGSLWINTGTLTGSGSIAARGGARGVSATQGCGGGGRIALYFTQNTFGGILSAAGALGYQNSGAGTIYSRSTGEATGHVLVDNSGIQGLWTPFTSPETFELVIRNQAKVTALESLTLSGLMIETNGLLSCTTGLSDFMVSVLGDVGIDAGGKLDVSGLGYAKLLGPGAGVANGGGWGTGAGHGGVGGTANAGGAGGGVYDSIVEPTEWGSGGGGVTAWSGGGAVRLVVAGDMRIDGSLVADGFGSPPPGSGGGAGGSLWINTGTLTGGGLIAARGGAGSVTHGGAGGGRIALYSSQNTFGGTLSAVGGVGYQNGGAGTVYTKLAANSHGMVLVDNGGNAGLTRLNSSLWPPELVFDLTISGAATVKPDASQTFRHLVLGSGAVVTHDAAQAGFHWICLGDAWIASGTSFNVDGLGYPTLSGPGAGQTSPYGYGSGGGHGGFGAQSYNGGIAVAPGGGTYGSRSEPVTLGSGGGGASGSPGGSGGGAVRLTVSGTLHLDGVFSANGLTGSGSGAGGSIWLTAQALTGNGSVSALGGGTVYHGAAGGGGRIAIWANDRSAYTGTITTTSANSGTVYMSVTSAELSPPTLGISGGNLNFTIQQSVVGRRYQLQYSDTMAAGTWQDLGVVSVGDGNLLVITTPSNPAVPQRFYRLGLE